MKSLLLLYGQISLPQDNTQEKEVIHITDRKSTHKHALPKSSSQLIPELKDKLSIALLHIEKKSDISNVGQILKKAESDKARTILVLDTVNKDLIPKIPKHFLNSPHTTLVVKGEEFDTVSESKLSKIFHKAIGTKKFEFNYEDDHPVAIVSKRDFEKKLADLSQSKSEKIVLLFSQSPQTLNTLASEVTKAFPEIELIHARSSEIQKTDHKKLIQMLTVHFEKKPAYANNLSDFSKEIKKISSTSTHQPVKKKRQQKVKIPLKTPLKIAGFSMLIFVIVSALVTLLGAYNLLTAKNSIENSDISSGKSSLANAHTLLSFSSPTFSFLSDALPIDNAIKELIFSKEAILPLTIKTLSEIDSALRYQNLQNGQQAIARLTHAYFSFSKYEQFVNSNILGENTSKIASILQGYPDLGGREEKTYLLLFQNNSELRPTGGFIGSVGELKVKDGKIQDLVIQDVYQIDGQLEEHFEPHFIIRKHLQPHLYLRDSNFNIEFDESAQKSAQIYLSATGKKVDGVVAIDFEVIKSLLEHAGTIELPEHNLTLDHKRAQELIQNSIQDNFFPGSTKKKDILQSLFTKLVLKMEKDQQLASSFVKEIPRLLDQKHILFAFQDKNVEKLFAANGYTGSINDLRKKGSNIRNDIFGINEANIGVNKANDSLQRRVEYQAYLGERNIVSKATLTIFNTGKNAQNYKAYLRFITPKNSTLESVSIGGQRQDVAQAITDPQIFESNAHTSSPELQVHEVEEDQYKTFGFVVNVGKSTSQDIVVTYTSGLQSPTVPMKYSLMYIKQPGTTEYPLSVSIEHKDAYNTTSKNLQTQNGSAKITEVIQGDKIYELKISN